MVLMIVCCVLATTACDSAEPEAAVTTASSPAAYTVVKTWPEGEGVGLGAQITVPGGPDATRRGVEAFLRAGRSSGYTFVEAVAAVGDKEWVCAGERLVTEADRELAVFPESEEATSFPFEWVTCR